MDILSMILVGLISVLVIGTIGGIIFFVVMIKRYNYDITLWRVMDGTMIPLKTKGCDFDDGQFRGIKLLKYFSSTAPTPPPKALKPTAKGRIYLEGYLIDDAITWVHHELETEKVPVLDENGKQKLDSDKKPIFKEVYKGSIKDPLSSSDRVTLFNQRKKQMLESSNPLSWLKENLPVIANVMIIAIMMIGAFLFYAEYNDRIEKVDQTAISIQNSLLKASDNFVIISERFDRICGTAPTQETNYPETPPN